MSANREHKAVPMAGGDPSTGWRRSVRRRLLGWYDRNKRDLPWRRRQSDAYAQLVAESMLQQTQVTTVIAYYHRFIQRFPTVESLAAADLDDVLVLWSGLGYYRRARSLRAAAQIIVQMHGGRVPATVEELMNLPGIGRYTAGAIASVAYDVRAPILDGNVARVLMRLLAIDADPKSLVVRSRLWSAAALLLPVKRCGDFNQALMDLGAMVCVPRSPSCSSCPLSRCCQARTHGRVEQIPPVARRTTVLPATVVVAAVKRAQRMLFVQRPSTGLWAGLWELPGEHVENGESLDAARRRLRKRLPSQCRLDGTSIGDVTRQLSHRRITFHIYKGELKACGRVRLSNGQMSRWLRRSDLIDYGISRACEAVLKCLAWFD